MTDVHAIVAGWHRVLLGDRGARAALRRAQAADEVTAVPAFLALYRRVHEAGVRLRADVLARIALAVAEVKPLDDPVDGRVPAELRPGRVFGRPREGGVPAVSFARLRRLAETEEPDLFLRLLRSALVQVEGEGHPWHVSCLVGDWHMPARRVLARRRLLLDYAEAAPETLFGPREGEMR